MAVNLLLLFACVAILAAPRCSTASTQIDSCIPTNEYVTVPLRVSVTFAGTLPLFMRENTWSPGAKKLFINQLADKVRYTALLTSEEDDILVSLVGKLHPKTCSVVEFSYIYDMSIVDEKTASALDADLQSILTESTSIFVDGTAVADKFWQTLQSDSNFRPSDNHQVYNILIYDAISVAPQYGYRAEEGGTVGTVAVASEKRFAIIDVGAKPFFLAAESLTVGDLLASNWKSAREYSLELHGIVSKLLTPPASTKMRHFPQETRISFKLSLVDVSAVIGRMSGVAGESEGNKPLGASFNSKQFMTVLNTVFHNHVIPDKEVSILTEQVDMMRDANMAMAVSRAFSVKGLEMVLDSELLIGSLMRNSTERYGYFVDSSFVAHVPLYLFSFADDSRITHFDTGEQVRARVVGKEAVVMAENRLRDAAVDEHVSTTSEATKEVLELLCGLNQDSLSLLSARDGVVPVILRDIARRNILVQVLDWSQVPSWKAKELLDFEGLDSRLIPHQKGSRIEIGRNKVRDGLRKLTDQWHRAAMSLSLESIESATMNLMGMSNELADMLHEEVCNQALPEEILLKAEVMGVKHVSADENNRSRFLLYVVLSAIAGAICGGYLHWKAVKQSSFRGTYLDDLAIAPAVRNLDVVGTTQWFSTLTSSYKSKTH